VHSTARHAAAVVGCSGTYRGKSMQSRELAVFAIRDGRIAEAWFYPEEPEKALLFFT
jgi:ketosteroid isomerase-like protein